MAGIKDALLGDTPLPYPASPGFKEPTTSRIAAESMRSEAHVLRERVLAELHRRPQTADEVAEALGMSILAVRPRVSELRLDGKARPRLKENGQQERRKNASGRPAIVWEAV